MDIPTLENFLEFPVEKVRPVVPASLIFAAGGTRRSAALSGMSRENYAPWALQRMLATCQKFYDYGVKHLIAPMSHPRMFQEKGYVGENFISFMEQGLGGSKTREYYLEANWCVRMIVAVPSAVNDPRVQRIQRLAKDLNQATPQTDTYMWYFVVPDYDSLWWWLIENLSAIQTPSTIGQAIRTLYGVDIPPTDLLISFGKPTISPDILPPLLWGVVQAYWTQQPSYLLNDDTLRKVFYDYAYLRNTYRVDKTGREEEALSNPTLWTHGPTIGLGKRMGPYWYPQPLEIPQEQHETDFGKESDHA